MNSQVGFWIKMSLALHLIDQYNLIFLI